MAIVTTDNRHYSDIANAIRAKNGGSDAYLPEDMADAVLAIPSGDTSLEDELVTRTISEYTNDRVTSIGGSVFYGWAGLTSIDFPEVISIGNSAFYNCSGLTFLDFPKATSIGGNAFRGCSGLTSINFPKAGLISNYAFYNCSGLTFLDFPKATSVGSNAFYGCSVLNTLILRQESSIVNLGSTNTFNGTPIADGTGYIYVPDDMVDAYKQATNWVNFANQIKGISELGV